MLKFHVNIFLSMGGRFCVNLFQGPYIPGFSEGCWRWRWWSWGRRQEKGRDLPPENIFNTTNRIQVHENTDDVVLRANRTAGNRCPFSCTALHTHHLKVSFVHRIQLQLDSQKPYTKALRWRIIYISLMLKLNLLYLVYSSAYRPRGFCIRWPRELPKFNQTLHDYNITRCVLIRMTTLILWCLLRALEWQLSDWRR